MPVWEGNKYKLYSSDNYDEYLKATGVESPEPHRKSEKKSTIIYLKRKGELYTLFTEHVNEISSLTFKLGEPFGDGNTRILMTMEGNNLIQVNKGKVETQIIREFSDIDVREISTVRNVLSIRKFRVIDEDDS